jgi:hypothetical protein
MNNTYIFRPLCGSAKRSVRFGFRNDFVGTQFLHTVKFRVNSVKAEFIDQYLVGRLANELVGKDSCHDKRGTFAHTYVLTTSNSMEANVMWQALCNAKAHEHRKKADLLAVQALGYHSVEDYERHMEYDMRMREIHDDLPF